MYRVLVGLYSLRVIPPLSPRARSIGPYENDGGALTPAFG